MICTENLRSAFTKDDVDEYLYKLLPERDAVVREMERLCRRAWSSHHWTSRGAVTVAARAGFRRETNLRDGVCDQLLHNLAGPRGGTERQGVLYR